LGDHIKEDEMVEALACVRILVGTHEGKISDGKIYIQVGR